MAQDHSHMKKTPDVMTQTNTQRSGTRESTRTSGTMMKFEEKKRAEASVRTNPFGRIRQSKRAIDWGIGLRT
jgi:hypothetical protein